MTLPKAIEILTKYEHDYLTRTREDFDDAVQLGNEAMKRLKQYRCDGEEMRFTPLPGETEGE